MEMDRLRDILAKVSATGEYEGVYPAEVHRAVARLVQPRVAVFHGLRVPTVGHDHSHLCGDVQRAAGQLASSPFVAFAGSVDPSSERPHARGGKLFWLVLHIQLLRFHIIEVYPLIPAIVHDPVVNNFESILALLATARPDIAVRLTRGRWIPVSMVRFKPSLHLPAQLGQRSVTLTRRIV